MPKALEASCVAGVVTVDALPVVGARILSEGVAASDGLLILDEDEATYLANIAPDLKTTIGKLSDALSQISSTLTSIGAGMLGSATAPPPALAADVAALNLIAAELTTLKESLK